jgi:alpha-2-macroglobulin
VRWLKQILPAATGRGHKTRTIDRDRANPRGAPRIAGPRAIPTILLLALLLGLSTLAVRAAQRKDEAAPAITLEMADRAYDEKSYAAALDAYDRLLKADRVPAARRDDVQYRIGVSLGKSQKWDRALEQSLQFVKTHRGTVWEPRGLYWLGRLYLGVPHNGWRVGEKVHRGNDVPQGDGEKPEQVYLHEQDQRNAKDAFEAARVFYPAYRGERKTEAEEIQLDFDLARILQQDPEFMKWAQEQKWLPPADPSWKVDPAAKYAPEWAPPKKLVYLYEQIRFLARPGREGAGERQAALGLFAKAVWLRGYHQGMRGSFAVKWQDGKQVRLPYPYENVEPVAVLRQLVREYPEDPVRDQAQFTLGTFLEGEGKFTEALAEFRRFVEERPDSKWVADARHHVQQITASQLALSGLTSVLPGKPAQIQLSYRNAKSVHFEAFRVKLEEILGRPERLGHVHITFENFQQNFGRLADARRLYGERIAEWDWTTKDDGKYQHLSGRVEAPLKETGAYVVEASVPGIQVASVLLVTDLVLVQKLHREGALFFAANATSGDPVGDTQIIAKQWWYEPPTERTAFSRGETTAEGVLTAPLQRAPNRQSFRVQGLAWKGSRYAITQPVWTYDQGDNPDIFKVYSVTDRSVYRPQQVVQYRQIVMRRLRGELKPVASQPVKIQVRDPQGNMVHERSGSSNEFGSVSGEFQLASEAPLGEYQIHVSVPAESRGGTQFGGNRFRVEEYKKPEFEVEVTPSAERVRLGQSAGATISAKYYFGGPVPGARVTYRVYRNYYAQSYQFPRPFDFLYRYSNAGDYDAGHRNGEVVSQGEARLDAAGEAKITFPTKADKTRWGNSDLSYTVEADVQDASRRTISGEGAVKATKHDVAVFLNFAHGYATKGDRVEVEIVTLNPSDQPVSVPGQAKVFRQPDTPDRKETLVHEEPVKTDAKGRALFRWAAAEGGHYRVAFVTRDTAEQEVAGSIPLWVQGPELEQGRFLFRDVFLAVENQYYEEGQTAGVLLVTPAPDCTVLLTREVNNEIVSKQVLRVAGRSRELRIPLDRKDAPNVYLSAVLVRGGQMLQATQELFVPPVRQFNTVTVQADRERYEPGEKAKLTLQARDWQGRPLRTELSVSVSDASLAYIQKSYAPDVRVYFHGDRRSMSVQQTGSPGTYYQPWAEDTQPREEFKTHQWVLPEGMGMLPDWPGEQQGYNRYDFYYFGSPGRYSGRFAGGMGGGGFGGSPFDANSEMKATSVPAAAPGAPPQGLAEDRAARKAKSPAGNRRAALRDEASGLQDPTLRTKFEDTAFWTPAVVTDNQGNASVEVTWPDNLTQWRAAAVGTTREAQVGAGETSVRVKKDLLVRLQAPRFFVERDLVVLSANVHNYTDRPTRAKVRLDLGDDSADIMNGTLPKDAAGLMPVSALETPESWIDVPKDGERRVDWVIRVRREGSLKVRMSAQSASGADATELTFPVLVHGVERLLARGGVLRDQKEAAIAIELPKERKAGSSELVVQLNPSMGAIMLDALPYLAEYPYGCLEQTISRFVPTVVVAKTLKDLGYDVEALRERARLLEEKERLGDRARPGGETVENSAYSYPKGRPGTVRIRQMAQYVRRWKNPVFDSQELKNMVLEGVGRVRRFQRPDGGWGWWPGDSSDPYMTAYALYGLLTARDAGYAVDAGMLQRGLEFLKGRFLEEDDFHRMAFEARVLALEPGYQDAIRPLATGRLFANRERLSPYSKALLATALALVGDQPKAELLLRNVETTARVDDANGTANWEENDRYWWRWWNNKVETNAAVLQAYVTVRPEAKLPPMLVKWLVNNRRGSIWSSTRETAMAVYALADYVRANKELAPEYTLTVNLADRVKRTYTVSRENALFFDNQFVVPDELLETGKQALTLTKDGAGTLYYSAYTRYFSLEEPLKATGNEIFVRRQYFRLLPGTAAGQPEVVPLDPQRPNPFLTGKYELLTAGGEWTGYQETAGGPRYGRVPLRAGETVRSGDLLEVELQLESKNDYDYLVFEDLKPAGCEPVEVRSGWHAGSGLYSNMELRDQKVAFFLTYLPQGKRTLSYRLRAEIPGKFHVLPANGYAMYAPDIRALSDEMSLGVREAEE